MARHTKIQWCDSTVNPVMGCDGCELWNSRLKVCYAGLSHDRFGGRNSGYAPTFEEPTPFPGRMEEASRYGDLHGRQRADKPWLDRVPRLIFVSDMGDALTKGSWPSRKVLFEFLFVEIIRAVTSEKGKRHVWLWLTKRPQRMAQFSRYVAKRNRAWPANLWAGTTVTTQSKLWRVRRLLEVGDETTRRFLSIEPQWENLDLTRVLGHGIDWVIQGGQSGDEPKTFDLAWARSLRAQCRRANIPYFLKQIGSRPVRNGSPIKVQDSHGGDWTEWPQDLRVRRLPKFEI